MEVIYSRRSGRFPLDHAVAGGELTVWVKVYRCWLDARTVYLVRRVAFCQEFAGIEDSTQVMDTDEDWEAQIQGNAMYLETLEAAQNYVAEMAEKHF